MKETDCETRIFYLQSELDDYRAADERRAEKEERARRERRREREEDFRVLERQATDWPEALRKGAMLYRREVGEYERDTDADGNPPPTAFWEQSAAACERALEIWREVEQEQAAEVAALEARLAGLRDAVRLETARRLRLVSPVGANAEHEMVARALLEMEPEGFLDW